MSQPPPNVAYARLRAEAQLLGAPLPPLLADAEHLAQTVLLGAHGRRRAGMGDEFWQYRSAEVGDSARMIDWRRSARSDENYVREKEWQGAQSVLMWVDRSASMRFSSLKSGVSKADRTALLAMAMAVLLMRAGERVALASLGTPPRIGNLQLLRISQGLTDPADEDYGVPEIRGMLPHSRALFVSDFMGDIDALAGQLTKAADRGVKGAILQVLDPAEEAFPYDGRTVFESMGGTVRHETLKAADLRGRYIERLAERKDRLSGLARSTGWRFETHHTDASAQSALLWLYGALEQVR
ncbi:DUF58 domain-containing protein [Aliiroseovarius sp. PTFE2010]|uniref:DUF58 domain-containing protein n=1 Tax=Aliiroseovarius sp. PTFE2010 TaxID=3417190 RepID=UPI003CF16810